MWWKIFFRRTLKPDEIRIFCFALLAFLSNAVICGVLSGPADRYQGRLIWLLPLIAVVWLFNSLARKSSVKQPV